MTEKRSSEILADENGEIFREKVKVRKFSIESENFSKIGGNLKQRGSATWSQRGWTPLCAQSHTANWIQIYDQYKYSTWRTSHTLLRRTLQNKSNYSKFK